jgi:predicted RecB family nuclease
MKISSQLFEAYLYCPTKCWLHSRAEPISGNMYAEWARAHKNTYYEEGLQRAFATLSQSDRVITPPIPKNFKDQTWQLAIGFLLRTNELETRLQAVARERNDGTIHFVPYRFEFLNKLTKEHKLLLAFDALLLSEVAKCEVKFGKIVHGDGHNTLKVKTSLLAAEVRKRLKGVTALVAGDSPPDLVLNRHCSQCEFQARCGQEALEKDELSLISRLSEKERKKLHRKGIFTVTQLSYTFRPRRHSARKTSQSLKYEPALKALAVRTKRAHVIGAPTLAILGHPVYFDVEGVPDSDFYYLIGMRHWCRDKYEHCYFWADTPSDERTMWASCFRALVLIDTPRLIHYGNYETQFLKRMKARYCKSIEDSQFVDRLISSSVNLISLTYAQVYFPTYSNSLKEIARYLGFQWSDITASGLNAIAWRSGWDSFRDQSLKQRLLIYNEEDCMAVQRVADTIAAICVPMSKTTDSQLESVNVHFLVDRYRRMFSPTNFALPEFKQINEAAYWDYHRSKVYIRSGGRMRRPAKRTRGSSLTNKTRIDKVIQVGDQRPAKCSQCGSTLIHKNDRPTQIIFDINFFPSGPRRRVIRYLYYRYRCRDCYHYITNFKRSARFGSKLCAYIIYMMIEMRLSQRPMRAPKRHFQSSCRPPCY